MTGNRHGNLVGGAGSGDSAHGLRLTDTLRKFGITNGGAEMPNGVGPWPSFAQFHRDRRPEMVHPAANCFVRGRNTAFRKQILNVAEAQSKPEIEDIEQRPSPSFCRRCRSAALIRASN